MARNIDSGGGSYLSAVNTGVNFTTSMTVSVWCSLDSAASGYLFSRSNGSPQRFCFGIWVTTTNYGGFLGDGSFSATHVSGSADPRVGRWEHVVFRVETGNFVRLFVNGQLDAAAGTGGQSLTASVDPLTFGGWANHAGGEAMDGRLAQVAVWNYPLEYGEILALYQGVSPLRIRPGNLRGYWPLDSGGPLERDLSVFACDATPTASAFVPGPEVKFSDASVPLVPPAPVVAGGQLTLRRI